ncbi:MAG: cell wall metabolism sensor histidine kinase WalK [Ignavibacteriales bacterium]|nr:cell wall metabolism sensor histidine kinase WalK [Ignavibacteriales bacterium]
MPYVSPRRAVPSRSVRSRKGIRSSPGCRTRASASLRTNWKRSSKSSTRSSRPTRVTMADLGLVSPSPGGLIEAQDGKIWAESEGLGAGATFKMTLPKA